MKPRTIIFIIIGAGVIAVVYWLVSPLWRQIRVDEALPTTTSVTKTADPIIPEPQPQTIKTGSFTGFDKLHNGSGTAKIITVDDKTYVRFESDFTVTNGPDLFVGFGKDGEYVKGSEIGELKGTIGSQNYELPAGFDNEKYNEVWIWCRAFSVPFARAELKN